MKVKQQTMLLTSNSTISFVHNKTVLGQQNSTCVFVDSTVERISKLCAYCVILLGSLFGNMFIITIVYKNRDLRKTVNYFIVNMAVSDLLFSMFFLSVRITQLATDSLRWQVSRTLGSIFCTPYNLLTVVTLHVSTQSLVWIAIDRFVAVVFPMKLGLISHKIRTKAVISTWIFAGVVNITWLLTSKAVESGNTSFCAVMPQNQGAIATHIWLHATIVSIAPLFVITVLYSVIAVALKRQNNVLTNSTPNLRHSLKKRKKAIQMAVVIVVLFYICAIPPTFVYFASVLIPSWLCTFLNPSVYFITNFALCSSSVVNPTICLLFVESYRRGLRNIFCSCYRKPNNKVTKCEQITLKRIRHIPDGNCG